MGAAPTAKILVPVDPLGLAETLQVMIQPVADPDVISDLLFLRGQTQLPGGHSFSLLFDFQANSRSVSMLPLMSSLPVIPGGTRLEVGMASDQELWSLLRAFPNTQRLSLLYQDGLDDLALQRLAELAPNINTLHLHYCHTLTPMGLLSLCHRLRGLQHILCVSCEGWDCEGLTDVGVQLCMQLLRSAGLLVESVSQPDEDLESLEEEEEEMEEEEESEHEEDQSD